MAKKPNDKRAERKARSERNMNLAVALLAIGFVAEFYLLILQNYFVKGTVARVVAIASYLEKMVWVGFAAAAAGLVLLALRGKRARLRKLGGWLLGCGVFFALSSLLMRYIYPAGTTAMCVLVPVLMILGIICLLYPAEFSVQAAALAMAIAALALLSRSSSPRVKLCAALALAGIALLFAFTLAVRKNKGVLGAGGRNLRVFAASANYRLILAVLAVCFAFVLAAFFAGGAAYYGVWVLAVAAFALAVYYTIKLM